MMNSEPSKMTSLHHITSFLGSSPVTRDNDDEEEVEEAEVEFDKTPDSLPCKEPPMKAVHIRLQTGEEVTDSSLGATSGFKLL